MSRATLMTTLPRRGPRRTWFAAAVLLQAPCLSPAETYYVSDAGSDMHTGGQPTQAWRTLARVNAASLKPNDVVLFRRGDVWRGQLVPQSGTDGKPIRYGAYGQGPKPLLLGSVEKNDPNDWVRVADRVWSTKEPTANQRELLSNPSVTQDGSGWNLYHEHGAKAMSAPDTSSFHSGPSSIRIRCENRGKDSSDIQFYTGRFCVQRGVLYCLTFAAKASRPFRTEMPVLMKSGPPWSRYSFGPIAHAIEIGTQWKTHRQFYKSADTADDARLTFFLGNRLPEGVTLHLDTLSLRPCNSRGVLTRDVGNIIFDHEKSCGVKRWEPDQIKNQGDYWYDEDRLVLRLVSAKNPALFYQDIKCAIREHIIHQSNVHHVIYEHLTLKYGAAHGIGGANTHHITVRDCDFGWIGGGDQRGGKHTVRYGNGVEFWANAHDCLVERCRLWEIYDAALTNQSNAPNTKQYNITYRNNLIWNCEYSFEYWNRPESSSTWNIRFENNTCINAGHGWGHRQRPDPSGRQLCFYSSPAAIREFHIRNNIFFEAKTNAFYAPHWTKEQIDALLVDHNCWYQADGTMIRFKEQQYSMRQFERYRKEWRKEPHSIVARPDLVDLQGRDFRLRPTSPCIDAGMDVGITRDITGTPVPQGGAPEIGATEFRSRD